MYTGFHCNIILLWFTWQNTPHLHYSKYILDYYLESLMCFNILPYCEKGNTKSTILAKKKDRENEGKSSSDKNCTLKIFLTLRPYYR